MHRLMLTSEAYQMASRDIPANVAIDPENRLFWRMPRQRLEAEAIRDVILAVAGTLDRTLGGPNVFPYIDPDLFEASSQRNWPGKPDDDPATWRRSLYVFSKRSIRYPLFEAFDQPNLINSIDRRNRSTVAPQALLLMNNALRARCRRSKFAERLRREAGDGHGRAGRARVPPRARRDRRTRSSASRPIAFVRQDGLGRVLPRAVQPQRVRVPPMSDHCCSRATDLLLSRRELISRLGGGIAGLAFADLLGRDGLLAAACSRPIRSRRSRRTSPPRPRRSSRSSATAASARSTRSIPSRSS